VLHVDLRRGCVLVTTSLLMLRSPSPVPAHAVGSDSRSSTPSTCGSNAQESSTIPAEVRDNHPTEPLLLSQGSETISAKGSAFIAGWLNTAAGSDSCNSIGSPEQAMELSSAPAALSDSVPGCGTALPGQAQFSAPPCKAASLSAPLFDATSAAATQARSSVHSLGGNGALSSPEQARSAALVLLAGMPAALLRPDSLEGASSPMDGVKAAVAACLASACGPSRGQGGQELFATGRVLYLAIRTSAGLATVSDLRCGAIRGSLMVSRQLFVGD
jgi:hypothetical protein